MMNLNIKPLNSWANNKDLPLIIAGPCSAESESQLVETAKELAKNEKVHMFRAGIWKPRTRPGSFEGVGTEGLEWMKTVKQETGLPVTTEVANSKHVEACLKAGIDVLWIGARTTVNPFTMQEIADAVRGVDIPIMIKNPVNPDLSLWKGAIERINQAGITKLAVIHRGCTAVNDIPFRNDPAWSIPIDLKVQCPELPIICDPSHIAGNRNLISFISQKALDLNMSGLMIESHINPDVALSDAKQQISPRALKQMLNDLVKRSVSTDNEEFKDQLTNLRTKINAIDEELVEKFAARMDIASQIGKYKKENNVTILQLQRWDEILNERTKIGEAMGLSTTFMKKMLQLIHQESIRIQTGIMNK